MTLEELMKVEENLTELPYSERQLIVIVPDDAKVAELKAMEEAKNSNEDEKSSTWWDYATSAVTLVAPRLSPYWLGAEFVVGIYNGIKKLRQKEISIKTVSCTSSDSLTFAPGHPQKKCVYVGNPVNPQVYFSLADFHRMMIESKFTEVVNLLMSLGAEDIKAERVMGWGSEITASVDGKLPTQDEAGIKVCSSRSNEKSFLFEAKLNSTATPKIPENLSWFPFEPTWQMISQGRIYHGLKNFTLNVNYLENFGITADLNSSIKGGGLSIGGQFTEHQSTIWKITGQFADKIKDNAFINNKERLVA